MRALRLCVTPLQLRSLDGVAGHAVTCAAAVRSVCVFESTSAPRTVLLDRMSCTANAAHDTSTFTSQRQSATSEQSDCQVQLHSQELRLYNHTILGQLDHCD